MTDAPDAEDLAKTYEVMLVRYVANGHEGQLEAAYALGRRSFAAGVSLLELLDLHRGAVEMLLAETPPADQSSKYLTSFGFLAEALGTFDMVQRGYREAQERTRLEQERAAREHAVAMRLQRDLLPSQLPELAHFDVAIRYRPAEIGSHAGGDWYDVIPVGQDRIGFVVGDVTGHGVTAAALMGQIRIATLAYACAGFTPDLVITAVDSLFDQLRTDHLATMVYAVADPVAGQLELVNAGHPPGLIIAPDGEAELAVGGHDRLVGMKPPLKERKVASLPLPPGSLLLLYTDGLIEPVERRGVDGVADLRQAVSGFKGSADDLCDLLLDRVPEAGTDDDICILAAEVTYGDDAALSV